MRVAERLSFRVRHLALGSCLAALLAAPAWGIGPSQPCSTPSVFPGAAVNAVILPYRYTDDPDGDAPLSLTGERLSLLVQLEIFFSMIKYGSVGAVRLVEDRFAGEGCDPDVVLAQLLGEQHGAAQQVAPGRGLVLLWGRIYEEGNDIFVQSYARFLRRGTREELMSRVGGVPFLGRLPFQAVAFAPRRLTREDLQTIEREFAAAAVVRTEPNDASPGQPLPLDPRDPLTFGAVEVREGWIRVESFGPGPRGWIRASLSPTQWPLRKKMPELSFVDGVVGYLRDRVGDRSPGQTAAWAAEALGAYRKESDPGREATAVATSHLLAGFLSILKFAGSTSGLASAQSDFERASKLVPYSADARNLSLMAWIALAYKGGRPGLPPKRLADELFQAAALEPQNGAVLDNLESFYRLLGTAGPPPGADPASKLEGAELQERLRFIQSVERPRG